MRTEFRKFTQEEIDKIVLSVNNVNKDDIKKQLEGRGGKLRTGKPKDPLLAFIWRDVRFHSGIDPTMPVTNQFNLYDAISNLLGYPIPSYCIPSEINKAFSVLVDDICDKFELDKFAGVARWKGLLF
jgi:hypothetical protein